MNVAYKVNPHPKYTLLLSRPLEDAKHCAPDFQAQGWQVVISPVMKIIPLPITSLPHPIETYGAICLTSRSALHALETLNDIPKSKPLFCVGAQTAQALRTLGFTNITMASTAQQLLSLLPPCAGDERLLYLSGKDITLDFSKENSTCDRLVVYDTHPTHDLSYGAKKAFKAGEITHLALYSKRSAELLHQQLKKNKIDLRDITAVALSPHITSSLNSWGLKDIIIAPEPTHQSLVQAAMEHRKKIA